MQEALHRILPPDEIRTVLVAGDLILDEYLHGDVQRISPEAPVPVLASGSRRAVAGGAANVASNLAALGCRVLLSGVVGEDKRADRLLELLSGAGIEVDGVLRDASRPTTRKLRVIAHQQQVLRIDEEKRHASDPERTLSVLMDLIQKTPKLDGIICSDYAKGFLSAPVLEAVIEAARHRDVPIVVDPKGTDYRRYRGVLALTPNLRELAEASGVPTHNEEQRDEAAARVLAQTEARALLLTCGAEGMRVYDGSRAPVRIPALSREVYDVTGAGDTVVSLFGLAVFAGEEPLEAARLANVGAGVVVGKLGTATVSREELEAQLGGSGDGDKVVSRMMARNLVERARKRGQKIVFTNGCFDLLHAGHVVYLEAAKAHGDLLVIGLNSDCSVRSLKGDTRPLVSEQARARVLAALGCVDLVVLFDEETPAELVAELRPHVLVKGSDYRREEIAGRDTVEGDGGRIELIPLEGGWSTSKLIETILSKCGARAET